MDCNPNDPAPLPVADGTSGTYRCPNDHGPETYGVVSGELPRPFVGQLAHPFRSDKSQKGTTHDSQK
jgi:hypothetical protein